MQGLPCFVTLHSNQAEAACDPKFAKRYLPVLARIISSLAKSNDNHQLPVTKFHAVSLPGISVADYMERLAKYSDCSPSAFILALVYLDRCQQSPSPVRICSLNAHRLLLTAVMLAAKFIDDRYYSNGFYARIGGVSNTELNALEAELLFLLGFDLTVSQEQFLAYDLELRRQVHRLEAELQHQHEQQRQERQEPRPQELPQPQPQRARLVDLDGPRDYIEEEEDDEGDNEFDDGDDDGRNGMEVEDSPFQYHAKAQLVFT